MQKVILPNGLTILFVPKKGNSVVVEALIKVGSDNEKKDERGISHFIEHILFEGTKKRPTNHKISNDIEKLGGDLNAYTTNDRTCFYIKVLKKHFKIAIDVLLDILQNPLMDEKNMEKEKNVVIKEIEMVHDEPRFYQWDFLQKNIFEKNPAKNPVYGDKEIVKNLTREKVRTYFDQYYCPNNMIISIVGDVKNWKKLIQEKFVNPKRTVPKFKIIQEPLAKKNKIKKETRDIASTYAVMGFKTVPCNHKDSYALEIIDAILGRGQSGRMFTEIRTKKGLAYDVGTQNINEPNYGYFAIYASIDKKNIDTTKKLILQELKKLENIRENDLKEAKTFIEGQYYLEMEDAQKIADQILFWEKVKDTKLLKEFIKKIKKVTINDVKKVAKKYFNHYTFVVIQGK
jgi:predicted Zn-dependent peptidase